MWPFQYWYTDKLCHDIHIFINNNFFFCYYSIVYFLSCNLLITYRRNVLWEKYQSMMIPYLRHVAQPWSTVCNKDNHQEEYCREENCTKKKKHLKNKDKEEETRTEWHASLDLRTKNLRKRKIREIERDGEIVSFQKVTHTHDLNESHTGVNLEVIINNIVHCYGDWKEKEKKNKQAGSSCRLFITRKTKKKCYEGWKEVKLLL